jgi:hypothetical protein
MPKSEKRNKTKDSWLKKFVLSINDFAIAKDKKPPSRKSEIKVALKVSYTTIALNI